MAISVLVKLEAHNAGPALEAECQRLDGGPGEAIIDLSALGRIDAGAVAGLEAFVRTAESKSVQVIFTGVNVDVYRVLKLVKLAAKVSFTH